MLYKYNIINTFLKFIFFLIFNLILFIISFTLKIKFTPINYKEFKDKHLIKIIASSTDYETDYETRTRQN